MKIMEITDYSDYKPIQAIRLIKFIKKNCQPYLNEVNCFEHSNNVLYRGMKKRNDGESPAIIKPRTNRRPLNTQIHAHEALIDVFDSLGFVANRNNSIFCTSNPRDAKEYGSVYALFPIGDFQYTYSEYIEDLYMKIDGILMSNDVVKLVNYQDIPVIDESGNISYNTFQVVKKFLYYCYSSGLFNPSANRLLNNKDAGSPYDIISGLVRRYLDKGIESGVKPEGFGTLGGLIVEFIKGDNLKDCLNIIENSHSASTIMNELKSQITAATNSGTKRDSAFAPFLEYNLNALKQRIIEAGYTNKNLINAVNNKHEVMIHCKKALVIPKQLFDMMLLVKDRIK